MACVNLTDRELNYLKGAANVWCCSACTTSERILRSNSGGGRPISPSPSRQPAPQVPSDGPLTIQHFNMLMERMIDLSSSVGRIEKRQNDLFEQLSACTETLSQHSKTLSDHESALASQRSQIELIQNEQLVLSDKILDISRGLSEVKPGLLSSAGPQSLVIPEVLERVEKSHNLLALNVPEGTDPSHDVSIASAIVDCISESASQNLLSVDRLPSKDKSRPAWLRLRFSNPRVVSGLLRNKSRLLANRNFRDVVLRDDKTKSQVAELDSLRRELKRRQSSGEKNITIKYVKGSPTIVQTATATGSSTLPDDSGDFRCGQ